MTEDRDFKDAVRRRSAKTGESYQAARRQMERRIGLTARVHAQWAHPAGLVLGCVVDQGQISLGMPVTVLSGDGATVLHEGSVASLRVGKEGKAVVASGECGILLDPPFHGYVSREIDDALLQAGALKPVETIGLPYLVVG
jgi:translation initiation factor IF-2